MKGAGVSAEEAVKAVRPGDRVLMAGEPTTLVNALLDRKDELADVHLLSGLSFGEYAFLREEYRDTFGYTTWQMAPRVASAIADGHARFLPLYFALIPSLFAPDGPFPIDVGFICTSPPNKHGYMSFGISMGYAAAVAKHARVLVAEVNARMPRTTSTRGIHVSHVDSLVEIDRPLIEVAPRVPSETDRRIGELVTDLIPDGATLEIGLGAIPNAVCDALRGKRELGIHSGMISDGFIDLVESGAVTNARKPVDPGKTVTGEVVGTQAIFDYVDGNPNVEMHPVDYTHASHVLGQFEHFCAVNSAVEVDLAGQINAEAIGGLDIGCGGQLDFTLGAAVSRGGRAIVALASTGQQGRVSRIVPRLDSGVPVTVPRVLTQYVVTEYGVADLRSKDLEQRAQALIAIAHPDFREELERCLRDGAPTARGRACAGT